MANLINRAKVITSTTGTGTVALGAAVLPYQSWSAAGAVANLTYDYLIEDGTAWEIGSGLYNGTTVTRPGPGVDPNFASSTGALLNLSGNATVACAACANTMGMALYRPLMSGVPSQLSTGLSTWVNQGTAIETDSAMGMTFSKSAESSANVARGLIKSAPATPYAAVALLLISPNLGGNNSGPVFGWYDGSNKLDTITFVVQGSGATLTNVYHITWASPTATSTATQIFQVLFPGQIWLRAKDDGTNVSLSISYDGIKWFDVMAPTAKSSAFLGSSGYSKLFVGTDAFSGECDFTLASYTD